MMFASAGAVMENVTGKSWEEIIRQKIFEPLDMKATCFTNEEMMKTNNYSRSYFVPAGPKASLCAKYISGNNLLVLSGSK